MTAPNMAAITTSLERSLQKCSLNHHQSRGVLRGAAGPRSSSSDDADVEAAAAASLLEGENENHLLTSSDTSLELNSHLSIPYHWEQCLDLKTGEIYYINWRNGMKAKEDPRLAPQDEYCNGDFYSEDDSSYDSEESSSESSPPSSSRENYRTQKKEDQVLVVAGCKGCLMYFMVPKQVEDCPKCNGQLLHFDRSENGSSP